MLKAKVNEQLVPAGPDSLETTTCPACGGRVKKRKRRNMGGRVTYFYRHKAGVGEDCRLRYRPAGG